MTDEEKKAIEILKLYFDNPTLSITKYVNIVLNLIEKQQKEIEELKETLKCTQNSWFEDTQKIEEMKKQIDLDNECEIALNSKVMDLEKEIEELKTQIDEQIYYDLGGRSCGKTELLRYYKKGYDMNNKFWKYKIKAKIEKSELLIDNSQGCMSNEDLYKEFGKIEFGKSLLEEE